MLINEPVFKESDMEALKILEQFVPDKVFDAHAHLYDSDFLPGVCSSKEESSVGDVTSYIKSMLPLLGDPSVLKLNAISYPDKSMADFNGENIEKSDRFLFEQLNNCPDAVGEIMVHPKESAEHIESRLVHPSIKGFKCYHLLGGVEDSWNLSVGDYLPEGAWEVANAGKMCITLHMVKDKALADEDNMNYICNMAKRYPDAKLILAHAARSFASWTGVESVEKIVHLENVLFDFSGICESPSVFQIMKKAGVKRCMWGSDYPVSNMRGKAVSLADSFYWIYKDDFDRFESKTAIKNWLVGIENLMAVRQACIMLELGSKDIEDLFYNNANVIFN